MNALTLPARATTLVVPGALVARGAVVPAAREWRGNGRKAHSSEGANSYG
jgi:hypothetical protein